MESYSPNIKLGLVAGALSGLIGIGGGIIIVPALVFLFGMTQHNAQGTTLALLIPPIGILAAWTYYKAGYVDIKVAALVALGFFAGSYLGAKISANISDAALERIFGIALILIGVKMVFAR
jgi:uncharacterized membrane protein YfcA